MNIFYPFNTAIRFIRDVLNAITPFSKLIFIWGFLTPYVAILAPVGTLNIIFGIIWLSIGSVLIVLNRYGFLNSRIILTFICMLRRNSQVVEIFLKNDKSVYSIATLIDGSYRYSHVDYFLSYTPIILNDDGTVLTNILNVTTAYKWMPANKNDRALHILKNG